MPIPNVAEILGPLLARVPKADRPLLLALAERMAAERYRGWADQIADPGRSAELRACAEREEEIARRIEALYPDAAARRQALLAANPDVAELNRSLFADRPLEEQFAIQAAGERAGAATWRAFADGAESAEAGTAFLGCAPLEEENAAYLEFLLERGSARE